MKIKNQTDKRRTLGKEPSTGAQVTARILTREDSCKRNLQKLLERGAAAQELPTDPDQRRNYIKQRLGLK